MREKLRALQNSDDEHTGRNSTMKLPTTDTWYIANQGSSSFDEIQRMSVAYVNGQPIALEGVPGVGKNEAISLLAKAFGKQQYRIRCTEEQMVRDIIGGEKLEVEKNGNSIATKTAFQLAHLARAAEEGNFAILDEVNQLTATVQKGLNSILEESRTIGSLEGAYSGTVKVGFGLFLTYNPETGIDNSDLEEAVKDRCKIFHFKELPKELKARLALLRTSMFCIDDIIDASLSIRGLQVNGLVNFAYFDKEWLHYGNNEPVGDTHIQPYLHFDQSKEQQLTFEKNEQHEVYQVTRAIVATLDHINSLRQHGTSGVRDDMGIAVHDVSRLNLVPTSPRLVMKLVNDYNYMRSQHYSSSVILDDMATSIIDNVVPSVERNEEIGKNLNIAQLIEKVCHRHGISSMAEIYTLRERVMEESRERIIDQLASIGYTRTLATNLVREYS